MVDHLAHRAIELGASPTPPGPPGNCALCGIVSPQCVTFAGGGATYLILVGDAGTMGRFVNHNAGDLFNLAGQTEANFRQAQGYNVVACRVSSYTDFHNALLSNGFIGAGVSFYGHAGPFDLFDTQARKKIGEASILGVGNATDPGSNVTANNVNGLADVQNAFSGPQGAENILGASASITLDGCKAGLARMALSLRRFVQRCGTVR